MSKPSTASEVLNMATNVRDCAWPADVKEYMVLIEPMLCELASRIKADEGAGEFVGVLHVVADPTSQYGVSASFGYSDNCGGLAIGDHECYTHPPAQAAQHAIDTQIVEWLERLHNLHTTVEALYVVDGYHVSVCWDDAPIYVFKGETLRDAYRAAMCVSYKDRRLVREPVTQVEETCSQCGSTHLDTGWECNDCGHDNQSRYSKTSTVTPVVFETPEALAAWLDSLHECDASGTVSNRKFEAAQIAATAIRLQLSRKD